MKAQVPTSKSQRHLVNLAAIVAVVVSASCKQNATPVATAEPPTLDVTSWTDKSELFMEHPPLVAGADRAFRRASDAACGFQRAERRPPVD